MAHRTYHGLRLTINDQALSPLTVRALGRIVRTAPRALSLTELNDDMFGIEHSTRPSAIAARMGEIKYDLDELCELNPDLIEAGPFSPVGLHAYRLTEKALAKINKTLKGKG